MKRSGVYQIVNEVNGKSYVGSSIDILNRWRQWRHYHTSGKALNYKSLLLSAFQKYGIENFTFIILEECAPTKELLESLEQHYLDAIKPEYNLLPQAYTMAGYKFPEEHKLMLRETYSEERRQAAADRFRAYMNDPTNKQRYSELRKGKTFVEIFGEERAAEILAKQSENRTGKHVGFDPWNKGVPLTEEQRIKMEAGGFWDFTDERRQKLSEAHLGLLPWNVGVPWSEEAKQKMSEAHIGKESPMKGVSRPEELKKLLSDIAIANFDPDHQQRMTEAARIANTSKARSDETRQKISESNLKSEKRKAFAESVRGIARTDNVKQKVSEALQASNKAKAYHEGRVGKSRGNNPSGHYGVIWDKAREKYQVRIKGKSYGRYQQLEGAIAKAKEVMADLGMVVEQGAA